VTNISPSFYLQDGGDISGIDVEQNYVSVTLCCGGRTVSCLLALPAVDGVEEASAQSSSLRHEVLRLLPTDAALEGVLDGHVHQPHNQTIDSPTRLHNQ